MDTESFGKILKKAREQNGLSLKQVSVAIKINALVLENIENEELDQLPKPVFTRGLIRTYCKYLDVDEEKVLHSFDAETNYTTHTAKRAEIETSDVHKTPFFLLVSRTLIPLFIIGILASAGYGVFLITQKYKSEVTVVKTDDIHAIHTAKDENVSKESESTTAGQTASDTASTVTSTEAPAAKTADSKNPSSVVKTETTLSEAEITQRITLEPSAKTLVHIQIDDEEVQKIILRPDVNRTFQAKKRIKLSISDAGAVNIIYNRKDLGVLGVLGQALDLEFPNTNSQKQ